jgi:hypothetical protein
MSTVALLLRAAALRPRHAALAGRALAAAAPGAAPAPSPAALRITLDEAASARFPRWALIPPAVLTHVSLGSVFAWSIFNEPLTTALGAGAACRVARPAAPSPYARARERRGAVWRGAR